MKIVLILAVIAVNVFSVFTVPAGAGTGVVAPAAGSAPIYASPEVKPKSTASAASGAAANADPTSCAYRRQAELNSKSPLPGRVIPECKTDGKYAPLQCHGEAVGGGQFCQCWDPEGNIIRGPSKKIKACDCILQRHQATSERPRRIGAFVPACDDSGHFKKHQCHGSAGICWCAHPANGTQIGEKVRGLAASSCGSA